MGAYTCEYGIVHKTCRCPTPHAIKCDVPLEHGMPKFEEVEHSPLYMCLVLRQKLDTGCLGKHEAHPEHDWWYTSKGGGHQLSDEFVPSERDYDEYEGPVKKWHCPGRDG